MDECVSVVVKKTGESGCITRRLNSHSYEIWLEDGSVVILSPEEFNELERKMK